MRTYRKNTIKLKKASFINKNILSIKDIFLFCWGLFFMQKTWETSTAIHLLIEKNQILMNNI